MGLLAVIGGTGLNSLDLIQNPSREAVETPFGYPSAELVSGRVGDNGIIFLARHGDGHRVPPHKINYRANLWALKEAGVSHILAIAAVGGIRDDMGPGVIAVPDQIIDYTWGREQSFFGEGLEEVTHIDFGKPYSESIRQPLMGLCDKLSIGYVGDGTYAATQGPRLETAAEIKRMANDGAHMVGMTGMPEASLARELGIDYATCAIIANWAAGLTDDEITMEEIEHHVASGMQSVVRVLPGLAAGISIA